MSSHTAGIIFAAVTGVSWALLAIALKYALHFSSSGTLVWIRMVIATAILYAYLLITKRESAKKVVTKWNWRIIIAGFFLAANYFGYMEGLRLTSASNAQIMIQLGPLMLLFLGVFYFKETLGFKQWLGIAVALVGFLLFNKDQWHSNDTYLIGNVWILFAAITWGVFAGLQKVEILAGWTPQEINVIVYALSSMVLFPLANIQELSGLSLWQWVVLFSLGLNTFIAYGAFGEALQRIPASQVSLIVTMNPLLTIFLMTLFFQFGFDFVSPEPIYMLGYLGAFLVVAGVASAVYFRKRPVV